MASVVAMIIWNAFFYANLHTFPYWMDWCMLYVVSSKFGIGGYPEHEVRSSIQSHCIGLREFRKHQCSHPSPVFG